MGESMSTESSIQERNQAKEEEAKDFFNQNELRTRCFIDKYALRDEDGGLEEGSPVAMWQRIANAMASVEETPEKQQEWEEKFYWLLDDFKFVPGGRIMFGAGNTQRKRTLLNCYVIPIKDDSIEAIWDCAKQMARTYSYGGGVGTDISNLRPKGAPVHNTQYYSSGATSFMDLYSLTTGTIGQNHRRGALMITINVEHPDVLDFIDIKNDKERQRVRFANISVRVTDKFMDAVRNDENLTLRYSNDVVNGFDREVRALEVWSRLIANAHSSAEPGIMFWDNVKNESTTEYNGMEVVSTNPCSEIPLEPYGCCCLGNINLSEFVIDAFTEEARVDWQRLETAARYATRFLDNVLDYSADLHPLEEQKSASLWSRRIGVGFTGFGDMLVKLNLKYDSEAAVQFTDDLFNSIKNLVYDASTEIAEEKGTFPAYEYEKHIQSPFIHRLDETVQEHIRTRGLRNAALLTVPPVGSGSVLAGTTSGIEPIFARSYTRRSESLAKDEFKVYHGTVLEYMQEFDIEDESELPDTFVTSHEINPRSRVQMQATIQQHIDHSISSTVNLARDITEEEVGNIYELAWQYGCKSITVYREGSREGILLTEEQGETEQEQQKNNAETVQERARPHIVQGRTQRLKTGYGNMYVTINSDGEEPFEVFTQIGKSGGFTMSFTEAISRLISLALRSGIAPQQVIEQLRGIRSPMISWDNGNKIYSIPDGIALALQREITGGYKEIQTALPTSEQKESAQQQVKSVIDSGHNPECPDCNAMLIHENGCIHCVMCGWSQC